MARHSAEEPRYCPRCRRDGFFVRMKPGPIRLRQAVGRHVFTTEWTGYVCTDCGAQDLLCDEFFAFYRRVTEALLDGVVDEPAALNRLRREAFLTAKELARLL